MFAVSQNDREDNPPCTSAADQVKIGYNLKFPDERARDLNGTLFSLKKNTTYVFPTAETVQESVKSPRPVVHYLGVSNTVIPPWPVRLINRK